MFVGHYGVSFAAKRGAPTLPLWFLFVAVQLLDVVWAPLVLLGIEKVRIVPGITRSNPLDLYYMPYTHSLPAAILWSVAAALLYQALAKPARRKPALVVGVAVFSHWALDFLVHRPDLPLYDNTARVGLGLWNLPVVAFSLELLLLFGGIALCARAELVRPTGTVAFGTLMAAVQAYIFFGPPPASPNAAALTALASYILFAMLIHRLGRKPA